MDLMDGSRCMDRKILAQERSEARRMRKAVLWPLAPQFQKIWVWTAPEDYGFE